MWTTFFIPRQNVDELGMRLEKLAKVASKLSLPAITWTTVSTLALKRSRVKIIGHDDLGIPITETVQELIEHEAITVKGEAPVLSGWAFVAVLQHEGEVTLVRSVEEGLPERFRTASPDHCDHCGTKRKRNDTYVVRHDETGEYKQVGRSCLKDFMGHKDPEKIASYFTAMLELFKRLSDGEENEPRGSYEVVYGLEEFLAVTSTVIEECGWVSKGMAYDSEGRKVATAEYVQAHFSAQNDSKLTEAEKNETMFKITAAHDQRAKEALAWVKTFHGSTEINDYIHNLIAIVKLGYVTPRMSGYAASIVSGWMRAKSEELKKKTLIANGNKYVGEIKKRAEFLLTLIKVFWIETDWGMTAIHKFSDPDGNAVTWFASNAHVVLGVGGEMGTMVEGATYRVDATPKKHEEYDGRPQTVVNRVVVGLIAKVPKKKRKKKAKKKKQ